MTLVNGRRRANGLPPFDILPGAYEPADEYELDEADGDE